MTLAAHHPFVSARAKAQYVEFNEQRARAWPVPCDCRTVDTPHGHTFVRVSGPPDGPPLVLLPGGGNHSLMWLPNIAGLSERHRTYAVDSILDVGRSANEPGSVGQQPLAGFGLGSFDVAGTALAVGCLPVGHTAVPLAARRIVRGQGAPAAPAGRSGRADSA